MPPDDREPAQLVLPFAVAPRLTREAFMTGESNREAVEVLESWPRWPASALALVGPPASGKTHLARLWAERVEARLLGGPLRADRLRDLEGAPAVAIELADPPEIDERALLHLVNALRQRDGYLLLTARAAPAALRLGLPDLASRLKAMPVLTLKDPDDALMEALLAKHFRDHGIEPDPGLLAYLGRRIERSALAASGIVARLCALALAEGRAPTIRRALQLLGETAPEPAPSSGDG